ncbi:MAG: redox-regulated ATPase YchF [Deltaproteobacteria bacterium]|nr:redox-regulated ATPase YchF [Deltaproteobacteria bacterium]
MKIAFIGLPNSGKTTIFNALTKAEAAITNHVNAKAEPNQAVIHVGDDRVTRLSKLYHPKKTTYATIEMVDFSGFNNGSGRTGLFPPELMQQAKNAHALALVVRNFKDDLNGAPTPVVDLEQIRDEMLLADLVLAEGRLERIQHSFDRGIKSNELISEESLMRKITSRLEAGLPIQGMDLSEDQKKIARGFQFLSGKPQLVILNSGESEYGKNQTVVEMIERTFRVIEFAGKFETELSRLEDAEEARMFMEDMGIRDSARDRLTRACYGMLGYINFFTVGPDEVRAWNVRNGDSAVDAAGAIHSDIARGFIRAECFSYDDILAYGSEKGVREKGRFRVEGKNYLVQDGDILNFRFNV